MKKTIVIAFDGLDYELIKKFDLENIPQKEFGTIDNDTGINRRMTSELFASFITGKLSGEHGIEGLVKWTNPRVGKIESFLEDKPLMKSFKDLRHSIWTSINSLQAEKAKFDKEDLECNTIFEEVENSRAIFVPGYNPSVFWKIGAELRPIQAGYSLEQTMEHYDTREFRYRKNVIFSELENDIIPARDFLMCHFHRSDTFQHLYGDDHIGAYDEEKLEGMYNEIDELAGKIKENALEKGYERIIFMSDHGLPDETEHNRKAFYSSNVEIFAGSKPHITDFYERFT